MKKLTEILLQYVVNTNLGFFCKMPKKILVPCFLFTFHQSTEPSSERFAAVYSKTQRDALCAHNSQHSQTWVFSLVWKKCIWRHHIGLKLIAMIYPKPPVVMAGRRPAMTTAVGRRPTAGWLFKKTAIWRCEIVMESDRVSYLTVSRGYKVLSMILDLHVHFP